MKNKILSKNAAKVAIGLVALAIMVTIVVLQFSFKQPSVALASPSFSKVEDEYNIKDDQYVKVVVKDNNPEGTTYHWKLTVNGKEATIDGNGGTDKHLAIIDAIKDAGEYNINVSVVAKHADYKDSAGSSIDFKVIVTKLGDNIVVEIV
ncbi:MAG: hypothetical protein FWF56_05960 [Firmicutes bacterium]|nr:hypothetical protein [Bacillota bacterium]MCL1953129.1 hypothetical protein [Bacillota bacterium]